MDRATPERRAQIAPAAAAGVTEALIARLVHGFYARVRQDAVLGPIFADAIGDDWDAHLAKLCDFWSSVMLMTGRFQGAPMAAHVKLGIGPEHFERWLGLFKATAADLCPPDAAALFAARAEMIARSLQLGIAAHRGELPALKPRIAEQ